jgi:thiol-disulfide isomerase/thioredoxin
MKSIFKIVLVCGAIMVLLAPIARADGTNLTAAQAWAALTNFALPQPPMAWQTNPPTQADLNKFDDDLAARAGVLADQARNFYSQFPGDANASRTRVTEVQALQMAVHYGATNRLADLAAREASLIADTNAPEQLRYALRIDQIGRALSASVAAGADVNVELEKAGRALVKEFPNGPEGYEVLQDQAEKGDLLKMHDLATVMAESGGPPVLTEIGKGLQRRLDAIGKPLPIEFTAMDGREVNLTTLSNKVVLVDFWGTWCPICVQEMPAMKKLYDQYHAKGFEIIGVNFDDDRNLVQRFMEKQGMTWPQYIGGRATNRFAAPFGLNCFPVVWLADKKGILRDIHGRVDMEAKIVKLLAE